MQSGCFPGGFGGAGFLPDEDVNQVESDAAIARALAEEEGNDSAPEGALDKPSEYGMRNESSTVAGLAASLATKWATRTLLQTLQKLYKKGIKSIFLEVSKQNKIAQNFYYKYKFQKVGVRPRYYKKKISRVDGYILKGLTHEIINTVS